MTESVYVSVGEARQMLGVSDPVIARMLRDGTLAWEVNPMDHRGKIIKRADVLALVAKRPAKMPPRKEADAA
jgi:helix-turn-helix protein